MTQSPIEELIARLRTANTVPEMAKCVALIMRQCGIYDLQKVGLELARISVTSGLGKN